MPENTGAARPRRRTVVVILVVAVVALTLVAGVVAGVRWWTRPDLFEDQGASMRLEPRPVKRATLHVGVTNPAVEERDDVVVTFRDATAHFSENSAQAEVAFWICSGKDVIGAVGGRLAKHCDEPRPLEPDATMTYSSEVGGEYVVVTLRPTRPGQVRLDRVDLDYVLGSGGLFRRGTDSVDLDVTLEAR